MPVEGVSQIVSFGSSGASKRVEVAGSAVRVTELPDAADAYKGILFFLESDGNYYTTDGSTWTAADFSGGGGSSCRNITWPSGVVYVTDGSYALCASILVPAGKTLTLTAAGVTDKTGNAATNCKAQAYNVTDGAEIVAASAAGYAEFTTGNTAAAGKLVEIRVTNDSGTARDLSGFVVGTIA